MVPLTKSLERIVADRQVQHGKPCIRGTRTPVYIVLESLATGMTVADACHAYPPLAEEDVRACLRYAALLANQEEASDKLP